MNRSLRQPTRTKTKKKTKKIEKGEFSFIFFFFDGGDPSTTMAVEAYDTRRCCQIGFRRSQTSPIKPIIRERRKKERKKEGRGEKS